MVRRQGFSTGFGAGVGFVTAIVLVVIGLPMLLVVLSCGGCLAIGLLGNAGRNAEQARSGHATASSRQYGRQLVETPEVAVGPIDGFMRYTIRIEPPDARHDGYTGIVKFLELPHRHETVSKIVRETMRQLIAQRPEATHMVMAFDAEGMAIGDFRYCGALDHKPGYPVPRRNLGEAIEHLRDDYSVVIELAKPLPNGDLGSTAMFFGFAKFPTDERIVRALQFEIRELNDQTGDVNAYVYLGTPDDRLHWSQIPTDDGNFRGMEFDAESGKIVANWPLMTSVTADVDDLAAATSRSNSTSTEPPSMESSSDSTEQTPSHLGVRRWMLDDGEEIVGRLKRIVNQRVEIERENGTVVEVLKEQLSEEDRRFLDSVPRR